MDDLIEWLRAQLGTDAAKAQAAIADDGGQDGGFEDASWLDDQSHPLYARIASDAANLIRATAVPRRVLAEVDAKRRILDRYEHAAREATSLRKQYLEATNAGVNADRIFQRAREWEAVAHLHAEAVRDITLPYADRPGYREAWRP